MFVKDVQGRGGLAHGDEFLSPLDGKQTTPVSHIHTHPSSPTSRTLRIFSGLICGGGGMMGKAPPLADDDDGVLAGKKAKENLFRTGCSEAVVFSHTKTEGSTSHEGHTEAALRSPVAGFSGPTTTMTLSRSGPKRKK